MRTEVAPSSHTTSLSLLVRVKANDQDAWKRFVRLYGPLVETWCRRMRLRDQDTADVFQEVFRAAAVHIGAFRKDRENDTFRGWLWTITRSKIYDHFRSKEPLGVGGSNQHQMLHELPNQELPPEPQGTNDDQTRLISHAMSLIEEHFEEQTRKVFWRTAVDGLSAPDVAEEFGISAMAVRKAKSRVLKRLRDEFSDLLD